MREPGRAPARNLVGFKGIVSILAIASAVLAEYAGEALLGVTQPSADPFPLSIHIWDAGILMLINKGLANPFFTWFFGTFTWLGSNLSIFTIGVVLYLYRRKREGALVLASLIAGTLVTFPLKLAIMRPRPFLTIPDIVPFGVEAGSSFPSGHAVRAFAFAFVMSRLRPKLKILLYLFAGLIAFSRIYLGQHYLFDVFAGILIGVLAGCFTVNNQGKILKTISGLGIAADS